MDGAALAVGEGFGVGTLITSDLDPLKRTGLVGLTLIMPDFEPPRRSPGVGWTLIRLFLVAPGSASSRASFRLIRRVADSPERKPSAGFTLTTEDLDPPKTTSRPVVC